jgi:hypothetical protein
MGTMQYAIVQGQLRHWLIDNGSGEPIRKDLVTLPAVLNELSHDGWEVYWVLESSDGKQMVFVRRPA